MAFDATIYKGFTEGPFGIPMPDEMAIEIEQITKSLPSDERHAYRTLHRIAKLSNEIGDDERADISILSTDAIDRDFEVVMPGGLDLKQFKLNPVVTFAHKYDMLPVGSAKSPGWVRFDKSLNALKAKTIYAEKPDGWEGPWLPDAVFSMVKAGILPGKSVGFIPIEVSPPTPEEIKKRPELADVRWIHRKGILLEYAVAPVQSNPQALVEQVSKGTLNPEIVEKLGLELPEVDSNDDDETSIVSVSITAEELAELKASIAEQRELIEQQAKEIDNLSAHAKHYRIQCPGCDAITEQCRCSGEKETLFRVCDDCKDKPQDPQPKTVKRIDTEKERQLKIKQAIQERVERMILPATGRVSLTKEERERYGI